MTRRKKSTSRSRGLARAINLAAIELDPEAERVLARLDPAYRENIEANLSAPELLDTQPKKRQKGRPVASDKWLLLDAIAKRKAERRGYMDLRLKFGKTPKQMTDLVHDNKNYLARKVKEIQSQ